MDEPRRVRGRHGPVAGLAIVRAHNSWTRGWPVLITLVGWMAMLAGLGRRAAPVSAQEAGHHPSVLYGSLVALLVIGLVLTLKAYGRSAGQAGGRPAAV